MKLIKWGVSTIASSQINARSFGAEDNIDLVLLQLGYFFVNCAALMKLFFFFFAVVFIDGNHDSLI